MAPPDERDRGGEDLFEDLDKFFEPIDEGWPDEAAAHGRHRTGRAARGRATTSSSTSANRVASRACPRRPRRASTQVGAGGAAGGVASCWPPRRAAIPATPDAVRDRPGRGHPGDERRGLAAPPRGARRGRRVHLPDRPEPGRRPDVVLGEAPDETATFPREDGGGRRPGDVGTGRGRARGSLGAGGGRAPVLTLDDLKKAPPEYRDLPVVRGRGRGRATAPGAARPRRGAEAPAPADGGGRGRHVRRERSPGDRRASARCPRRRPPRPPRCSRPRRRGRGDDDLLWDDGDEDGRGPARSADGGIRHRARTIEDPLGIGAVGGPAWEEPTSHSVTHDLVPPGLSERNLPAALITAGVLIVAAIVSLWISKAAFAVVASTSCLIAQAELYATMHRHGYQPATALGLVVGAMVAGRRVPARRAGDADVRRPGRRALVPVVHGGGAEGARGRARATSA